MGQLIKIIVIAALGILVLSWFLSRNQSGSQYFNGYECTSDCSGHEAGYQWAEDKGITDPDDCGGNSQSFIEGCRSYTEENSNYYGESDY